MSRMGFQCSAMVVVVAAAAAASQASGMSPSAQAAAASPPATAYPCMVLGNVVVEVVDVLAVEPAELGILFASSGGMAASEPASAET